MKLGAACYGFREQTVSNYFEIVASLGLRYVEVPLYWQVIEDPKRQFNYRKTEGIQALLDCAEKANVKIATGVTNCVLALNATHKTGTVDKSNVAFGLAWAKRSIDICEQLDVKILRVMEPNVWPHELDFASDWMKECGRVLGELGEYAVDKGVVVAVENYGLTSAQVEEILVAANSQNVGTLYDPCNYYRIGEDPLEALRRLRERIVYCHLKDAKRNSGVDPNLLFEGSRWAPSFAVGEGEIDWQPIVSELTEFFCGYVCIEYEDHKDVVRGMKSSLDYFKRQSSCTASRV